MVPLAGDAGNSAEHVGVACFEDPDAAERVESSLLVRSHTSSSSDTVVEAIRLNASVNYRLCLRVDCSFIQLDCTSA